MLFVEDGVFIWARLLGVLWVCSEDYCEVGVPEVVDIPSFVSLKDL